MYVDSMASRSAPRWRVFLLASLLVASVGFLLVLGWVGRQPRDQTGGPALADGSKVTTIGTGAWRMGVVHPDGSYVTRRERRVTAYTADDQERWSIDGLVVSNVYAGPNGDTLLMVDYTRLVALDAGGRVRWQFGPLPSEIRVLGIAADGTVYVHHHPPDHLTPDRSTATIVAVDSRGRSRDVLMTDATPREIAVAPDGALLVYRRWLTMYERTGARRWAVWIGRTGAPPAPLQGGAVVGYDTTVRAFDHLGHERWRVRLDDLPADVPIDRVVTTDAGRVYARAWQLAVIEEGRELWRWTPTVEAGPVLAADGTAFIRGNRGAVLALRPDGSERWRWSAAPVDARAEDLRLWLGGTRLFAETHQLVAAIEIGPAAAPGGARR
jgi:outer membrane protein assembly factor BamB